MTDEQYSIGELAELSGTTVRTIQYYDQIDLLVAKRSESNLRYYTKSDLMTLQQILFYKRLDFPLKEIKHLIENVKDRSDLKNTLKQQETILFRKEMALKMNQVIIGVVSSTLEMDAETELEPLMKLVLGLEKETIMAYTNIEYADATHQAMDDGKIQFDEVMDMYWNWKELVLEAASLKLSHPEVESELGYQLGEKWQIFLEKTGEENSQMREVAEQGAEKREQWPDEDLFLYNYSKDFIETVHQYYLKKKGDRDD